MLIYTYPMCILNTTNNSRTERVEVPFNKCADNLGWNYEADCMENFCLPFIRDDAFTIQINLSNGIQNLDSLEVVGCDGTVLRTFEDFVNYQVWNEFGVQSTINLVMSDYLEYADCFRIRLNYETESYLSEQYCLVKCEEPTILLCSDYTKVDCNGLVFNYSTFYDSTGTYIANSNCIRLKGVIVETEKTVDNVFESYDTSISSRIIQTKSSMSDKYEMRIWGIPNWMALKLKAVLGGNNFKVTSDSGVDFYEVKSGFSKNSNKGNLWFPVVQLSKTCTIFSKSC